MTITELKAAIETNNLGDIFFIFQLEDDSSEYISNQYIKAIADKNKLEIKYVDEVPTTPVDNGFITDDHLYIISLSELKAIDRKRENCIIICRKTRLADAIKIPKLLDWQFTDYIQSKVPGMNINDIKWLVTQYTTKNRGVSTTNYFRMENDLDKVGVFDESVQDMVFNELYQDGEYNRVSPLTVFDLADALARRDLKGVLEVMKVFDYIDSKPDVWVWSILTKKFRQILTIQAGINQTPESAGVSEKQFFFIKKNLCGIYSDKELIDIYQLLTNIEYQFKFSGLSPDQITEYLICKILGR